MADVLVDLVASLCRCLDTLKNGEAGRDIHRALHGHEGLPDKAAYERSAQAVDLLHETLQLLEPSTLVLADHFFGYTKTKCLCAAVELDIPDILKEEPKPIARISKESGANPERLAQVLRSLVNHVLLLREHWTQWRNWINLYGNQFYDIARGIPASCKEDSGRNAAQHNFNTDKDMFTYFQEQGWSSQLHTTLSGGATAQAPGILADYPWGELEGSTFLDVGGGTGGLVTLVLRANPTLHAGILDLPHIIDQASTNFHSLDGIYADVGSRIEKSNLFAGDFLQEVPQFEVYTMKWCLHDWNDSKAITVLRNIRKAMKLSTRSRLIILESVLTDGRMGHLSGYADINMMTTAHSGQERSEDQWMALAQQTGWKLRKIYPLRNSWAWAIEFTPSLSSSHIDPNASLLRFPAPPPGQSISSEAVFLEPWNPSKGNPFIRSSPALGYERSNINWVTRPIQVRDARPFKEQFSLDTHGFSYTDDSTIMEESVLDALRRNDKPIIEESYYSHIEGLLKRELGAKRVIIFDHTIRQRDPGRDRTHNAAGQEQPATMVHCDQTSMAAQKRLEQNLDPGENMEELLSMKRVILVNVWRPLRGPVEDWPLGTIDYRSLVTEDVHNVDLWTGMYENHRQTVALEANDAQLWWYLHGHRIDEVTMIKIWDSQPGDGAKCTFESRLLYPDTKHQPQGKS
ncbi:hypothetical protein SLS53_002444 [Cytospora paraplurivora]|uniref:O-methyltransferase domain-containing protein n=1 Tax=Cytospora paraplurivora TaxID=2898453 RepID=A0AAN9UHC8_9PEZI